MQVLSRVGLLSNQRLHKNLTALGLKLQAPVSYDVPAGGTAWLRTKIAISSPLSCPARQVRIHVRPLAPVSNPTARQSQGMGTLEITTGQWQDDYQEQWMDRARYLCSSAITKDGPWPPPAGHSAPLGR